VIKNTALEMRRDLLRGEIEQVGRWLHQSWLAKRELARGITDSWIDQWYEAAIAAGASGGKIAGAGGGGFLLLYCRPERQERVAAALESNGLTRMDFRFESGGAMVIMNTLAGRYEAAARPA
jgi:D-glycero-alpha-D-manno-heptose-7-phosphate kinase